MDEAAEILLKRLVRRISFEKLIATLDKWDCLTAAQTQVLDFTQTKDGLVQNLLSCCLENKLTVEHIAELEMIYVIENPNQWMWYTFQLMEPDDDAHAVELTQFKDQFKSHLSELVKHVSVEIKVNSDHAVWIRTAWGEIFSPPNHLKPTYMVHYLQTPYVFISGLKSKFKGQLLQVCALSTKHQAFKDANLSGRSLTAIRDLLLREYQQVFPRKYPLPLAENNQTSTHRNIVKEQAEAAVKRHQLAGEAFGDGKLPELQSAVYKLETKFKDPTNRTMTEQQEPFKCVVKFSSTNLLESFKSCASSGILATPVTPLLSSIPLKGRNYFVIKDNTSGPSPQMNQTQN